jgi:MFS family permease
MNISERLERLPLMRLHWNILLLTGIGWMFDAMDVGLVSFVMPAIQKEWSLTPSQLGILGSIGMVGMALGAAAAGMLADKWGRQGNHPFNPGPVWGGHRPGGAIYRSGDATDFPLLSWRWARR